jgi:cytochrome b561
VKAEAEMDNPILVRREPAIAPARERFDAVSIALHWGSVLLLAVVAAAAWRHAQASDAAAASASLTAHRNAGVLLWLLTAARLGWKVRFARPAEPPASIGRAQRLAARATQQALYVLLVLQPATGLLQTVLRGRAFPLLGVSVPVLAERNRALVKLFHETHEWGAWALLALIGLHAGAALFHHLVLHDRVLRAMFPDLRGEKAASGERD